MFIVMVISIFVFSLVGVENVWWRLLSRVVLLPVVAGVSYELLKFTGRHIDNPIVRALSWPGLSLQKLTTKEPDDEMLEVAIRSLQEVRALEEGIAYEYKPAVQTESIPETEPRAAQAIPVQS